MTRRVTGDTGASLVLVLLFLALFGVLVSVLLSQTDTSLRRSLVTRAYDDKVYAADAGVEAGIQQVRNQDALCPKTGSTQTLPPLTVNGKQVVVTCKTLSGSSLGIAGYGLVTTDTSDQSITTQSGGTKRISGNVFASGLANTLDMTVQRGSLFENTATCSSGDSFPTGIRWEAAKDAPSTVAPSPPWTYECTTTTWTSLDPAPTLGTPPLVHGPLADKTTPSCSYFRPGTYVSGISLGARNYFASGVYYFPSGGLNLTSKELVAGKPAPGETPINTGMTACGSDGDLNAVVAGSETIQGTGVTIVLGGDAQVRADNPDGDIELYTRTGGSATEGTQGVGIIAVPASPPLGWIASSRGLSDAIISVGTGNTPSLAVHGLIYTPDKFIDFNATNDVNAQLVGGVVTGRIKLQSSASADGLAVSIAAGPGRRRLEIRAVASESGSRDITSIAVVDIENDQARTPTVVNWRGQPN